MTIFRKAGTTALLLLMVVAFGAYQQLVANSPNDLVQASVPGLLNPGTAPPQSSAYSPKPPKPPTGLASPSITTSQIVATLNQGLENKNRSNISRQNIGSKLEVYDLSSYDSAERRNIGEPLSVSAHSEPPAYTAEPADIGRPIKDGVYGPSSLPQSSEQKNIGRALSALFPAATAPQLDRTADLRMNVGEPIDVSNYR